MCGICLPVRPPSLVLKFPDWFSSDKQSADVGEETLSRSRDPGRWCESHLDESAVILGNKALFAEGSISSPGEELFIGSKFRRPGPCRPSSPIPRDCRPLREIFDRNLACVLGDVPGLETGGNIPKRGVCLGGDVGGDGPLLMTCPRPVFPSRTASR